MSYRLLELSGMAITDFSLEETQCILTFSEASIIKVMDAAQQRTRWRQSGRIVIAGDFNHRFDDLRATLPDEVEKGEFRNNVFVYYNAIRLPCLVYGDVGISINFKRLASPLEINGKEIEVVLENDPKYIEHID